jgi:hypothetical protein
MHKEQQLLPNEQNDVEIIVERILEYQKLLINSDSVLRVDAHVVGVFIKTPHPHNFMQDNNNDIFEFVPRERCQTLKQEVFLGNFPSMQLSLLLHSSSITSIDTSTSTDASKSSNPVFG